MYMQMLNRLTTVCAFVGYKTETVGKTELIGERRELFDAFCKSLRLSIGHLDDVGIMLFGDEQKVDWGLRIQVLDDHHIVVFIEFCGRNFSVCYFAKMQSLIYVLLIFD